MAKHKKPSPVAARAFRAAFAAYMAELGKAGGKVKSTKKLAQLRAAAQRPRPSRRKARP